MGAGMLASMQAAGIKARGFDIRPREEFGALRGIVMDDASLFSVQLETLISVVRDIPQTEALLFDDQAMVHAPHLKRIVLCSTLSPRYVDALRDRIDPGIALIDAPMSGAQIAAEEARLTFMIGATQSDLDAILPLLYAMGTNFHHVGAYGAGMRAKVLNNLLAASHTAMTRLVLDWAGAQGLDPAQLLRLIETSSGQNWFASGFDQIEFSEDGYAPDNSIGVLVKDVDSALDAAPATADTALPDAVRTALLALRGTAE